MKKLHRKTRGFRQWQTLSPDEQMDIYYALTAPTDSERYRSANAMAAKYGLNAARMSTLVGYYLGLAYNATTKSWGKATPQQRAQCQAKMNFGTKGRWQRAPRTTPIFDQLHAADTGVLPEAATEDKQTTAQEAATPVLFDEDAPVTWEQIERQLRHAGQNLSDALDAVERLQVELRTEQQAHAATAALYEAATEQLGILNRLQDQVSSAQAQKIRREVALSYDHVKDQNLRAKALLHP